MRTKLLVAGLALSAGLGGFAAMTRAAATPPTPPPNSPSAGSSLVGVLEGPSKAKNDGISLKVRADTKVRVFTLTYPVGSTSGWHAHPGIVVAVVEQGVVKREIGCAAQVFGVNEAFTEAAPHQVTNVGTVPAVLKITQMFPAEYELKDLRIDQPAPSCPPRSHRRS